MHIIQNRMILNNQVKADNQEEKKEITIAYCASVNLSEIPAFILEVGI
jgi:hypothetical protein